MGFGAFVYAYQYTKFTFCVLMLALLLEAYQMLLLPYSEWAVVKMSKRYNWPPCLQRALPRAAGVAPTIPVGVHGCLTTTPTHCRDLAARYQARPAGITVSPCINSRGSDDPRSAAPVAVADPLPLSVIVTAALTWSPLEPADRLLLHQLLLLALASLCCPDQ
ncbi:hypothetical protein NL676_036366 [Syzygium grande]|nr:hypothetical protein NL676_036366 [Syzygium grande]